MPLASIIGETPEFKCARPYLTSAHTLRHISRFRKSVSTLKCRHLLLSGSDSIPVRFLPDCPRYSFKTSDCVRLDLVFPNSEDVPTEAAELSVVLAVSFSITRNLVSPEGA
jgi:hypothetical protein